jgi:hypothetical protein
VDRSELKEALTEMEVHDDVEFEFAASTGELPIMPASRLVPEGELALLPVFRIALPPNLFAPSDAKSGGTGVFEEFLELAIAPHTVLEKPSDKSRYWVVGATGYLAYVAASSSEVSLSLLMDHVTESTAECQALGRVMEHAVRMVAFGASRIHAASVSSPPAVTSPLFGGSSGKLLRRSAPQESLPPPPPPMSTSPPPLAAESGGANMLAQMRELTMAVCKYAQDTNAKLARIEAAVNK